MTGNDTSIWLTVREAARRLDKSQRTIRRWIADEKIPVDRTTPVMKVDIAGRLDDIDVTTPGAALDELTATIEGLEAEAEALKAEIDQLKAGNRDLETHNVGLKDEAEALRSKIDRLAADNRDLEADNERLRDLREQLIGERDYLRQAHAASLSTQQKLLEAQTGGRSWIERLLPWTRERNE